MANRAAHLLLSRKCVYVPAQSAESRRRRALISCSDKLTLAMGLLIIATLVQAAIDVSPYPLAITRAVLSFFMLVRTVLCLG